MMRRHNRDAQEPCDDRSLAVREETSGSRASERGFFVPELLVAVAMLVVVGLGTLAVLGAFTSALTLRSTSQSGYVALDAELDRMRDDASTAYAVFVPDKDIFGNVNAASPGAAGHEVDFYARTDSGAEVYWAYDYDAAAATLRRYDYDASRNVGVADRTTGAINTAAHYPAIGNVRGFDVETLEADRLTSSANPYAPAVAGIVGGNAPQADPVGFVPASGRARDDLYGGNTTVAIRAQTDRGTRLLHLATAVMPSGFTVHERPSIRGVVYRLDQVHRFWFGLAQITHAGIYEQLLYSYQPNAPPNQWKTWCDFELYGSGISGLRLNDPHTRYQPQNWQESMAGVFTNVENGSYRGLDADSRCGQKVPSPNATYAPAPAPGPTDVVDTPPPCFSQGQCWPNDAPRDWAPPSPWPVASPPPSWCATHDLSPLCGGPGGPPPTPSANSPPPQGYQSSPPSKPHSPPGG